MSDSDWKGHQVFEADWWGNCVNTFGEEAKQISYANRMGLHNDPRNGKWPFYDMRGRKIVDLGGGPTSLLLKCANFAEGSCVVDPCQYPKWISDRYAEAGIAYKVMPAEHFEETGFDEAWIYNVLQHVIDPEKIVHNAKKAAKVIRIFDWLDTPPSAGHPHTITADNLRKWLGGEGIIETFSGENNLYGKFFYGTFVP